VPGPPPAAPFVGRRQSVHGPPKASKVTFTANPIPAAPPAAPASIPGPPPPAADSDSDDSFADDDESAEPAIELSAVYGKSKSTAQIIAGASRSNGGGGARGGGGGAPPPPPPPAPDGDDGGDGGKKRKKKRGTKKGKGLRNGNGNKPLTAESLNFDSHVKPSLPMLLYANFIYRHPCICFLISSTLMLTFAGLGLVLRSDRPSFSKADKGFEPRGTAISGKTKAYERHLQDAQCEGAISTFPSGTRSWHRWAINEDDDDVNHADWDQTDEDTRASAMYCNIDYYNRTGDLRRLSVGMSGSDGSGSDGSGSDGSGSDGSKESNGNDNNSNKHLLHHTRSSFGGHYFNSNNEVYLEDGDDYDSPISLALYHELLDDVDDVDDHDSEFHRKMNTHTQYSYDLSGGTMRPETFCSGTPRYISSTDNMVIVLEALDDTTDLLSYAVLAEVCRLDNEIRERSDDYNAYYCSTKYNFDTDTTECCKSRTVANYVAQFANKTDCGDISAEDVDEFKDLLTLCASSYHVTDELVACLKDDVEDPTCMLNPNVPDACWRDNIVYDTFNALADWEYTDPSTSRLTKMKISVNGYPTNDFLMSLHNDYMMPKYKKRIKDDLNVVIAAYDLGIKFDLFNEQLIVDGGLAGAAFAAIYALMWLQTGSFFVSTLASIESLSALGVAYFVYMIVMWLPFFPFLNLVGVFIVIGIGADDVFVFMDAWKQSDVMMTGDHNKQLNLRMAWVLKRAGGATLVTSLTTSFAFFASSISNITGLKCFGIYTGIVVIADFVLMITYLPAVVMLNHMYIEPFFKTAAPCCKPGEEGELGMMEKVFKEKLHPNLFKGRWIIMLLLGGIGSYFTYEATNLQRPKTGDFQLFHDGHPMELYEMEYAEYFYQGGLSGTGSRAYFPVTFLWGLEPIDTGNNMDPNDHGTPQWVDINFMHPTTQGWLISFCEKVREQSWYLPLQKETIKFEKCFMESFRDWVTIPCNQTSNNPKIEPGWEVYAPYRESAMSDGEPNWEIHGDCCSYRTEGENADFPMTQNLFASCLTKYSERFGDQDTGVWYDTDGSQDVKALVFSFVTNVKFTSNFNIADKLRKELDAFEKSVMSEPGAADLGTGFYVSELSFYDLQSSIAGGAFQSFLASTVMAFAVLLFTTRNFLLTLYSCITIVLITGTCTGILVMDGWELNILESIIFSVAVGMAVDFVAHYSHAYASAPVDESVDESVRSQKTKHSLTVIGVSVSSAAFTTFVAGAVMCFSKTLFFYKFGVFMVLVMSMSWLFSTFFLTSTLASMGPVGNWGDIFCGYKGRKTMNLDERGLSLLAQPGMTMEEKMAAKFAKKEFDDDDNIVDPGTFKSNRNMR
jgi:hypothetical protein